MIIKNTKLGLSTITVALLYLLTGMSGALADQVTLSYVDENAASQEIILDSNTGLENLALAASLVGLEGVDIINNPNAGSSSLAEIAAAMAAAAPVFAPAVAEAFALMSPDDKEAIAEAVNAVSGVNQPAVLSAVHFGPYQLPTGPRWDWEVERIASPN